MFYVSILLIHKTVA